MTFQTQTINLLTEMGKHIKDKYTIEADIHYGLGDLWLGVDDIEVRCIPNDGYFVKRFFDSKGYDLGKFDFKGVMCLIEGKLFDSGIIYSVNDDMWWDYVPGLHKTDGCSHSVGSPATERGCGGSF